MFYIKQILSWRYQNKFTWSCILVIKLNKLNKIKMTVSPLFPHEVSQPVSEGDDDDALPNHVWWWKQ